MFPFMFYCTVKCMYLSKSFNPIFLLNVCACVLMIVIVVICFNVQSTTDAMGGAFSENDFQQLAHTAVCNISINSGTMEGTTLHHSWAGMCTSHRACFVKACKHSNMFRSIVNTCIIIFGLDIYNGGHFSPKYCPRCFVNEVFHLLYCYMPSCQNYMLICLFHMLSSCYVIISMSKVYFVLCQKRVNLCT